MRSLSWRNIAFAPDFSVVEETDDYVVVDKPAPLQVHPAKPDSPPTLLDGLQALLAYEIANGGRLSIINRLDRETSGLVLVAKHYEAARAFGMAMMSHEIGKEYTALARGWIEADEFAIDAPLLREGEVGPTHVYLRQCVHPTGAESFTSFRVIERLKVRGQRFTVCAAAPRTGRMHQIRVHLAHAGHPIVGDKLYGPDGPTPYLEFIETGWTESLAARLLLRHHALHSARMTAQTERFGQLAWHSPAPVASEWLPGVESNLTAGGR